MKYAALIFGDENRRPKKAADKSSPEPGQIVRHIDGSVYRVASKIAGPDGTVVKLANLQGKPVQTPQNFRPIGIAVARFASWMRYHLAYNKDFDLYINAYIERYNAQHQDNPLPFPVGKDGKAFRWANWFQKAISPKLFIPGRGTAEDQQKLKDEIIHEMLFNTLGERDVLAQFVSKTRKLKVNRQNAAIKLTDFLISTFLYRVDEMQNKLNARSPEEEVSMYQPSTSEESDGEVNILEQDEFGVGDQEFQSAEARRDVARFRESFRNWLLKPNVAGATQGENFVLLFDIFWRLLQGGDSEEVKRNDLQAEWIEKTGLSFGSFKDYFTRLPEMLEKFITNHGTELGNKNIFVDLMNTIREERNARERKERRHKSRPASSSMAASLNLAGVEEDFAEADKAVESPLKFATGVGADFAEALSNSENPDVVDPDIKQPTETAEKFAAVKIAKLVRGEELTPQMRNQVVSAFIYRWTKENEQRGQVYHCSQCDVVNNPYVNSQSAEGHPHPTIPLQSDDQWIADHAFYFTNKDQLMAKEFAEPAYLAPESDPVVASIQQKFAMEKAAYNPGMGQYIFQADVYCEDCGKKLQNKLHGTVNDEGDSDRYPQGPYFDQESDGPEHCARCGRFLQNPLTTDGYKYLNQMITEHDERGQGNEDVIEEWKAYYPEREEYLPGGITASEKTAEYACCDGVGSHKPECSVKNTDSTSKHTGMLGHDFNNADGQAIRNETYDNTDYTSGIADQTELKQNRVGADEGQEDRLSVAKTILEQLGGNKFRVMTGAKNFVGGQNDLSFRLPGGTFSKGINAVRIELTPNDTYKVTFMQMRAGKVKTVSAHDDVYVENLREVFENATGLRTSMGTMGRTGAGSNSGDDDPRGVGENYREEFYEHRTKGITSDALMSGAIRQDAPKIADGTTTVTMQNQNATIPNTPGRGQPMAVPDSIDQTAGPHSPNAPSTAPRSPGIQPRVVDVPSGTVDGDMASTASIDSDEAIYCPDCNGSNVDIDVEGSEGYSIYCEDCEKTTFQGKLKPGRPAQDYREVPDEWEDLREDFVEPPEEGPFDSRMASFVRTAAITVSQGEDAQGFHMNINLNGREYVLRGDDAQNFRREYSAIQKPEVKVNALVEKYMNSLQPYNQAPKQQRPAAPPKEVAKKPKLWGIPEWLRKKEQEDAAAVHASAEEKQHPDIYEELEEEGRQDKELHEEIEARNMNEKHADGELPEWEQVAAMSEEQKSEWLKQHGWAPDENVHGSATWWMQKQMWTKIDREEDIPYQSTEDAIEKEFELQDKAEANKQQLQGNFPQIFAKLDEMWGKPTPPDVKAQADMAYRLASSGAPRLTRTIEDADAAVEAWMDERFRSQGKQGAGTCCALEGKPVHDIVLQLAETLRTQGKNAANTQIMELLPEAKNWEAIAVVEAVQKHAGVLKQSAVAPAVAAPVPPNVQQNMNLVRPQVVGQPNGAMTAIVPGGGAEEGGPRERHTIEPELPNSKYHMSMLAAEEEKRIIAEELGDEYTEWSEAVSEQVPDEDPNARVNEYLRDMAARGFEPVPETVEALKRK